MRINHNLAALNAWRNISKTSYDMNKTLEKLSSGLRINRAGDDAAGLAISEKMRGQIKGLRMALKNAQDGISLIQTAEGALNEIHAILQRMRELAVEAASDTNTDVDRANIQKEIDQLIEELDRIARATEFNTKKLLDGKLEPFRGTNDVKVVTGGNINVKPVYTPTNSAVEEGTYVIEVGQFVGAPTSQVDVKVTLIKTDGSVVSIVASIDDLSARIGGITITWEKAFDISDFGSIPMNEVIDSAVIRVEGMYTGSQYMVIQIGANEGQNMVFGIDKMDSKALGVRGLNVETQDSAEKSIMIIDGAIHRVSNIRAKLGAIQNRLEHTIANLGVAAENLTAAESRIRDADMAKEMMEFTKQQILIQSGMAMLAQANTLPQNILQLLR